jgi:hypothetical protein
MEHKNRVIVCQGARKLTPEEVSKVSGVSRPGLLSRYRRSIRSRSVRMAMLENE